jgi:hypothetical protein
MAKFRFLLLALVIVAGTFIAIFQVSCRKDACQTVSCQNGGTCSGGICNCQMGWVGNFCQTSAFAGNWTGSDLCDSTQKLTLSIEIDQSSTDTVSFLVKNPHGFLGTVTATRSGATNLNFSQQLVSSVKISGSFTLSSNNALSCTYTIIDTGATASQYSCSGNYTRL